MVSTVETVVASGGYSRDCCYLKIKILLWLDGVSLMVLEFGGKFYCHNSVNTKTLAIGISSSIQFILNVFGTQYLKFYYAEAIDVVSGGHSQDKIVFLASWNICQHRELGP